MKLAPPIGYCVHCQLALHAGGPVHVRANGELAHVACERDRGRR